MIVDKLSQPIDLDTLAGLVARAIFGQHPARFIGAMPFGGAAGASYRLSYEVDGEHRTLFIKLPAEQGSRHAMFGARLREEYRISEEVKKAFPETARLKTVAPAAFIEEVQGFVTWEMPGQSLEAILGRSCLPWAGSLDATLAWCRQAGEWLQAFHRLPCAAGPGDARALLDTYYDDRLVTLAQMPRSGVSDSLAGGIKSSLMALVDSALSTHTVVRCHNDYSPHNMLVDAERLCVFDYSFAGPGLPAFDIACFWHKLDDIKDSLLHVDARVSRLQQAFLSACETDFDLATPAVKLGLARLVLSKMITALKQPERRIDRRRAQRRRYQTWLQWLASDFDPRHLRC